MSSIIALSPFEIYQNTSYSFSTVLLYYIITLHYIITIWLARPAARRQQGHIEL
jgi:hypothetical protein